MDKQPRRKAIKFSDIREHPEHVECREYDAYYTPGENGGSSITFNCPFCELPVKAYIWRLCGSGKRCTNCKALFNAHSEGYQWKKEKQDLAIGGRGLIGLSVPVAGGAGGTGVVVSVSGGGGPGSTVAAGLSGSNAKLMIDDGGPGPGFNDPDPNCETCNGRGVIGTITYAQPDSPDEPCPDCVDKPKEER